MVRFRAGLRVLPLGDGVQIGLDPRWAVRVTGLTTRESAALQEGTRGTGLPATPPRGVTRSRWVALLAALRAARLLDPGARRPPVPVGAADATAWGLLDPDGHGRARVAARARACVGVRGLGPTGLTVATALAAAGVGDGEL